MFRIIPWHQLMHAFIVILIIAPMQARAEENGIDIGGAIRFQYTYEDYSDGNKSRGGDIDLDTFRLNIDGNLGDIIVSAEWRYYEYMQVIHHAWVGYDFTDQLRGEAGITKVPFGNLPFNSHSFFFSSNYYLGLEDDYDAGIKFSWLADPWDLQLAFFKNDERGGAGSNGKRYSFDVIATDVDADGNADLGGNAVGETNTVVARVAYALDTGSDITTQFGFSALGGRLHDGRHHAGNYKAFAGHLNGDYHRWNLQLQATYYKYDLDSGGDRVYMGAYAGTYGIPADALTYTANLAYRLPVNWGPIAALTFYSDNSLVTNKSDKTKDTIMNILGVSMEAGPVFAYLDFVSAKNQPFIGGTMIDDSNDREHRVNLNIGYYF